MKKVFYGACLGAAVCLVFASTAIATQVEFLGTDEELCLVRSDPSVARHDDMIWTPQQKRDKRDFHEQEPGRVSMNIEVQRAICWRLESGQVDLIHWASVRAHLDAKFGRRIGKMVSCSVMGDVTAPRCFSLSIDVYSVYVRERYRVVQCGETAEFSVLRPTHGMGIVYSNLTRVGNPTCDMVILPSGTEGTCGSVEGHPLVGEPCLPATLGGPGTKRQFKDNPVLPSEFEVLATWGGIKALYEE